VNHGRLTTGEFHGTSFDDFTTFFNHLDSESTADKTEDTA
jgi:hypothetical protein